MQGRSDESNKVVSLFARKEQSNAPQNASPKKEEAELSFDEVMRRNNQNEERLRKERERANKGVLRSYRIKN